MSQTTPPDIRLDELGQLSPPGLVAFVARVAERGLSMLGSIDPEQYHVLIAGKRAAVEYAAGRGAVDAELPGRAYAAAEAAVASAGFSGYAAAHAARAVVFADRLRLDADDAGAFNELVASAYGAVRAVLNTSRPPDAVLLRGAHRADLDALLSLGPAAVDTSPAGPLGPLWPSEPGS